MRLSMYILLMICLAISAYWMGAQSSFQAAWEKQGQNYMDAGAVLKVIAGSFTSNTDAWLTAALGIALAAFGASLMGGFAATFIIPAVIIIALVEYLTFPIDFLFTPGVLPDQIRIPAIFLLNVLLIFGVVDFIRGKT